MNYKMERRTGAFLALKRPAHQTSLHCTKSIFQYHLKHSSHWLRYATQRRGRSMLVKNSIRGSMSDDYPPS